MTELLSRQAVSVPMNIADGLAISARRYPEKAAVLLDDRRYTYAQVNERSNRIGNYLRNLGLEQGDRVAVILANVPEYVELSFGIARAGFVIVPISFRLVGPEIAYQLNDSDARVCFYSTDFAQEVNAARAECSGIDTWVSIKGETPGGSENYESVLAAASTVDPTIRVPDEFPFCIYYTSGTTGQPKGAVVSHRSRSLTFFGMAAEFGCYEPEDYSIGTAPMYHGAGMSFCLATVYFGGTLSLLERFRPEDLLRRIAEEKATNVFMVPTMFQAVFSLPKETRQSYDLSNLRIWMSNASALAQATKELILNEWPHTRLFELYGSTEGGIVSALRPDDQLRKVQCVGHPFPLTEVKLLDDDGNEVEPNVIGELFSRSPYLFNGYHKKPAETQAGFSKDGFFSAGDLAIKDEEGYIYIVDRKKDLIISGGTNIYPREIEEVLFRHPAIADVAVIGVPDDYWGESVKAIVVKRPGIDLDEATVLEYVEGKVANFKRPRTVAFIDDLPRNAAGKVLKRDLRNQFK